MNYVVISESDLDDFEQAIKEHIQNGWELHGSLQVTTSEDYLVFSQALTHVGE